MIVLKTEKRKTIRLTLLLATALLLTLTFAAQAFAFTDLTNSSVETQKAVDKLVELGILNGYIDNTFRPDDSINRAEFAKVATL
ncbi:MAG: S-layer homology domain-containing protein, partial [Peptococcaceae bacterium]|nr:S-layer homology domain-containing protein [Peptococcaceae bacterium]